MPQATHVTDREAAALLRVHHVTVRRMRRRGALPTTRIGSRVFIPREALDAYLASHTTIEGLSAGAR